MSKDYESMSERERAEWLQAHKDDPDLWGEPETARRVPRRRLGAMLSIRLSAEELAEVRDAADWWGESISAYLRRVALADVRKQRVRIVWASHPGKANW